MVYNNKNIDESSGKVDESAPTLGESVQDVDKSAADQRKDESSAAGKDESGRGITGSESNQVTESILRLRPSLSPIMIWMKMLTSASCLKTLLT